ncbi:hypothetical protein HK104_007070 [Borealophlyctis nickersoniae]|nr:hypothetical protein HK104_007070 [Borealophlyctis nickersoniae]
MMMMMMTMMLIPTLRHILYDRRAQPRNHQLPDTLPIRRLARASDEGSGRDAVEEGVVVGGGGGEIEEVEKVFDGDAVVGGEVLGAGGGVGVGAVGGVDVGVDGGVRPGERFGRMPGSVDGYGTCGEKTGKTAPAPASAERAIEGSCDDGKETGDGGNKPGKLSTGEKRPARGSSGEVGCWFIKVGAAKGASKGGT